MENSANSFITDDGTLQAEIDRLRADIGRLRLDFSTLTDDAVHAAKSGTAEARNLLTDKAKAIAAKGRESIAAAEQQVVAHPYIAIGTALAVGALLGLIVARTVKA